MSRVVVTGGLGFIGSELVRQLRGLDYTVFTVDIAGQGRFEAWNSSLDLCEKDSVDQLTEIIDDQGIDTVFALAALIGGVKYFHDHPAEILYENNQIMGNTLEAIRWSDRKPKVVYVSSSMVFESTEIFPTREEDLKEIPLSAYGFSKLTGEFLCKAYHDQYGLDYVICRPFNAYGCNYYKKEVGISHVVPDLTRKILGGQGTADNPLEILGNGSQVRCYTHVWDVANGIIAASRDSLWDYNISCPKSHTVDEVAELIWSRINGDKPLHRKYLEGYIYDVQKRIPDTTRARDLLGWSAKYVLEDKIDEVIEWVRNNT